MTMYVGFNTNFSPNKYQSKLLSHVTHDQIQKSLEMWRIFKLGSKIHQQSVIKVI